MQTIRFEIRFDMESYTIRTTLDPTQTMCGWCKRCLPKGVASHIVKSSQGGTICELYENCPECKENVDFTSYRETYKHFSDLASGKWRICCKVISKERRRRALMPKTTLAP